MICIGGAAGRDTSDACTACLKPRCTRRTQGAQKRCATQAHGTRRGPTREKNRLTMLRGKGAGLRGASEAGRGCAAMANHPWVGSQG